MPENPWLTRRVIAYAHQGGARENPSSTLHAIKSAVDAGAVAVELDVHATADRQLVVCHDATLERTTNASGKISAKSLSELKELDNAYYFVPGEEVVEGRPDEEYIYRGRAPEDPRFGVASLEEVLLEFPSVLLNLDIKETAPAVEPYEELLAELLRRFERRDDVIVASFNDAATDAFSKLCPEVPTSAGTMAVASFYQAVRAGDSPPEMGHVALQVPASYGELTVVDEQFVEVAHSVGLAVHVWTINDRPEMESLLDLGVDGIISDVPGVLVPLLQERGLAWRP